jgi:site-specific DNA-methyltransferase (adenine-specific)
MGGGVMRKEVIGDCEMYLGNCLEAMPTLGRVSHIITDPPYEQSLHDAKNSLRGPVRADKGPDLKGLDFAGINEIRKEVVKISSEICDGWFIAFCTTEGVARWADEINESSMKYKRACVWVKPDSTPQLNGQGPAQGAENFVCAWAGSGYSKWNAGGKRGVYTHNTNNPDRTGEHPTEKPINLMAEIIKDFTNAGETILDPFMGSGTTGLACAKLGRKFIGIELSEKYFDLACRRIENFYKQPDFFIESAKIKQEKFI